MQTKEELLNKIGELEEAAEGLANWKKRSALLKIIGLRMRVESFALSDIANVMSTIDTSGVEEINKLIQKAKDSQLVQRARVKNLNKAIQYFKKVYLAVV
ncbi:hypothetical protein [uncultured Vibrio sp.]|uniref:hypothetical protein n=1 Tax=uncultured Vibrio sp. TaxID=114054 RepID=UPI0025D0AD28|nr:hypothetical protein [uncultured Vibrio sp.]